MFLVVLQEDSDLLHIHFRHDLTGIAKAREILVVPMHGSNRLNHFPDKFLRAVMAKCVQFSV